ncbi:hypothetical protein ACQ3G6_14330 [Allorhizobium undicola]
MKGSLTLQAAAGARSCLEHGMSETWHDRKWAIRSIALSGG